MTEILRHIEGCKSKDIKSQKFIYESFSRQMFSICLRYCRNRSDAEDVLQMGFVKVFENISQLNEGAKIGGWIRMIIVRTALSFIRTKPNFVLYEDNSFSDEDYEMKFDFDTYNFDRLLEHLHLLPVGYQTVFNLYVFEEMSHGEIAKKLNCKESTSRSQLYKARKELKRRVTNDMELEPLIASRL